MAGFVPLKTTQSFKSLDVYLLALFNNLFKTFVIGFECKVGATCYIEHAVWSCDKNISHTIKQYTNIW